ncbi:MAG: AAA family ATPase [Deltaproteobacteria bacterium]|nr:AAA family ATPase [Deltaproteobacteria bacterium]
MLRRLIAAKVSIVYVVSWEEERVLDTLRDVAAKAFASPVPFFTWSVTEGVSLEGVEDPETREPLAALDHVLSRKGSALYAFKDLHAHFGDARVVRRLRDIYQALKAVYKTIFLVGPRLVLPPDVEKDVAVVDFALPTLVEIDEIFHSVAVAFPKATIAMNDDERAEFLKSLAGLTADEVRSALTRLFMSRKQIDMGSSDLLQEEKRQIVRKSGILDFISSHVRYEELGGLENLKEWLKLREHYFSSEARNAGLPMPKGVLFTGISGCGKSLCVQAIAAAWHMPLLRLDMNLVFSGAAGTPEAALGTAVRTAESVAPSILWVDEIETAIVGTGRAGGGADTRIFSTFLTWMQEKKSFVFVAATANEIDALPPELLRKGRFDEIFFVDLPTLDERQEIFAVHLAKRGIDPRGLEILSLAQTTMGWSGAEIEQCVVSGIYEAYGQRRALDMSDLYKATSRMVPLSTTMAERIKQIKRWADTRAVKASRGGEP